MALRAAQWIIRNLKKSYSDIEASRMLDTFVKN
jgi:hypothetical protein